ncbi:MAG: hypothetical protein IKF78_07505 [Atopobiaceae bacterium]|nr:hypothetical protein [Atopobiaceae bacterium]
MATNNPKNRLALDLGDHEVGVSLRIDGYERTVLHNKASALGLTFGEYVQALVSAVSVAMQQAVRHSSQK